ncbi:MAG TPA: SHOCT domain-containing protein [Alphaproteobacteria bacterium]|nr:SHOCT domain-containing protein [Alphaproteobacteria bacterium]
MTNRPAQPGAATSHADHEAGTDASDAAEDRRRALFALEAMLKRGLLSQAEFESRRAELLAGS